ncbi:MAG TPA: glucose-6-phosphate isomerase [Gemmatimonadaceae bacterium]|jgi:glucose-6-phosphate isomerase|nr:glucose-6-phosphate isomerase [Gemmatimonadaceae bacterium]
MTLRIDYSNMMISPGGIGEKTWSDAGGRFSEAKRGFDKLRTGGSVGFVDLPAATQLLDQVTSFATRVRGKYDDVVILGIGGSALGPIALRTALRPSGWNMLDEKARDGYPRLQVLDNVDPETIAALLARLRLARTLFIVTSKSGGTAETMAQFVIVHDRLVREKLDLSEHLVFVTDPKQGALRPLADRLKVPALDIPPNVGGRFSVLTPVGTLPAALIGIDVKSMLSGAAEMARRCESAELASNPAGVYAMLQWLADTQLKKSIAVFMPYSDPLRDFAGWFVQLWAESLGKKRPDGTSVGSTPLAAVGATDQHAQVQMFMEGPADKTVTFVAVRERGTDVKIPAAFPDVKELGYLAGHSLGELIDIEQRATAGALAKRGRPNMTIHLDRVDSGHVGQLMMVLEIATAYAGQLYGIDAFNQPGVELGKQFAYALLGRPGADDARKEWDSLPRSDSRWTV